MFFMLSGFLIALTYKTRISEGLSFREFFLKRYFKLFPLYFMSVIFAIYTLYLWEDTSLINVDALCLDLLMIPCGWVDGDGVVAHNIPTWFVGVLLVCYIIYFFIAKLAKKSPDTYIILIGFMVVWGYVLIQRKWNFPFNFRTNGEGYLNFFLGVVLCELYCHIKDRKLSKILSLIVAVLLVEIAGLIWKYDLEHTTITISLTCFYILWLAIFSDITKRILSFKPLALAGKISMEIFFLHLPLSSYFMHLQWHKGIALASDAKNMLVYFMVLILLSIIVHFVLTKRIRMYEWIVK